MNLYKLLLTILLMTTTQACNGGSDMQNTKIHYKLDIQAEGVRYDIMINGITVQKDMKGHPLQVEIPVGQYVRSGDNSIDLILIPWKRGGDLNSSDDSHITLTLKMYHEDRDNLGGIIISQLKYDALDNISRRGFEKSTLPGQYKFTDKLVLDTNGDYVISAISIKELDYFEGAIEVTQKVHMQTPYPEWKFFKSTTIQQLEELSDDEYEKVFMPSLFSKYKHIHDALKRKDLDSIMPLFSERNEELDAAFYYKKGTYEKMLREALQGEFDDKMLLQEINIETAQAQISLYGNLAKLGSSPLIKFFDKEETVFNSYDILFRKEGNDWIISR